MYNKLYTKFINFIKEEISQDTFISAYKKKINDKFSNLLEKAEQNPNYEFVLQKDIVNIDYGQPNKCETNTFNYIKNQMEKGNDHYYPVGGFHFASESLYPIEHYWVYDSKSQNHFEVTPIRSEDIWCYAGIINYKINDKIKNIDDPYDIEFFKGGHVYFKYFK